MNMNATNMKRTLLAALGAALLAAGAAAEMLPLRINYQGKLIDPTTNAPKTGPVTLTFKLYNDPTLSGAGNLLYTETQSNIPLTNGAFSVQIGSLTAISRELFLGASVYLGVTVSGDSEMTPRQNLAMSAYAYTANQLSDNTDVRLVAGVTYSTFTNGGNLTVPGGVSGSSASFTNGLTASSGTFLAGGGSQYSIASSSGLYMSSGTLRINAEGGIINTYGLTSGTGTFTAWVTASTAAFTGTGGSVYSVTTASGAQINGGTLDVNGGGGITNSYGIWTTTLTFLPTAAPAAVSASQGGFYFDSTTKKLMISQDKGSWQVVLDTRTETMWIPTVTHPQATGTIAMSAVANQVKCVRMYMTENFLVERMAFEVTTLLAGSSGDVGIYSDAGNLIVHTGALSTASTGAKSATGLSGFLQRQTMYRYCFCNTSTTPAARSVNTTDVTNTLENSFIASPAEGTAANACAAGVLPATLGTITSASVVPVLSVIANTTGP